MKKRVFILMAVVLVLSVGQTRVEAARGVDPTNEKVSYSLIYLDGKTGRELERIDDIDGFVGETIDVDGDYVLAFRNYSYKGIRQEKSKKLEKESMKIRLGKDKSKNKVYVIYEKDLKRSQRFKNLALI